MANSSVVRRAAERAAARARHVSKRRQDAIANGCLKALQKKDDLRNPDSVWSWLSSLIHWAWVASFGEHQVGLGENDNQLVDRKARTPSYVAIRNERHNVVRQSVERLAELEQTVVVLRIYQELTFEEISNSLGRPLGTIYGAWTRALEKLEADEAIQQLRGK
jgi:RNA polymerase sigma-70 factor (ECF subfamily)